MVRTGLMQFFKDDHATASAFAELIKHLRRVERCHSVDHTGYTCKVDDVVVVDMHDKNAIIWKT